MKKLILISCLALAACFTAGRKGGDAAPAVYDLGPPAVRQAAPMGPALAIEVRSPQWLDSPAIQYRLAYAEPGRLRDYAQARWAGPPAALVQQRLIQLLGWSPAGQGGAGCLVRVDLDEFSQTFSSPGESRGVIHARLALLDRGRERLAERAARIERPSPSQDSRGGVAALEAAVGRLAEELMEWQGELARSGRLKGCERRP